MPIKKSKYLKEYEREAVAGRPWGQSLQTAHIEFSRTQKHFVFRMQARLRQFLPWLYVNFRDVPLALRWLSPWSGKMEETRKRQWLRHLAMHSAIFASAPAGEASLKTEADAWALIKPKECLEFIQHHLGVLDQKSGSLLALISILAAGLGLVVTRPDLELQPQLLQLTGVFLVFDLLLCLRASLRVRWGELGFSGKRDVSFRLHIENLIEGLVSRTARFRAATLLTSICVLMVVALIAGAQPKKPARPDSRRIAGALIFQDTIKFETGGLCGTPITSAHIDRIARLASVNRWQFLTLEGAADAVPIHRSASYGNNVGLALARVECVREGIERLRPNGSRLEITIKTRDAINRTDVARRLGNEDDRVVRVTAFEATEQSGAPH